MGKILDFIVGNTFMFIIVIAFLVALLVAIILSIVKSLNKHKIPIYEEINENAELENAKEDNVIEKPVKKDKIKEVPEKESVEETEDVEELEDNQEDEEENENLELIEEEIIEEVVDEEEQEQQEFDDVSLREELEKIDDKEIEERIDEEHKKNIDEEIKDNDNIELKAILSEMKDTNELDPEEVVRNFEEEQEAQSIISYQELVNVVKNRENDFDDELESRPLTTVSDFIKKDKKNEIEPEANVLDMIQQLDNAKKVNDEVKEELEQEPELEEIEVLEVVEVADNEEELTALEKEVLPSIPEEGRFKKTEVISPVFGRIQEKNKIDYPKVEKFNRRPKIDENDTEDLDKELLNSIMPDFSNVGKLDKKKEETIKTDKKNNSRDMMFEDLSSREEKKEGKAGTKDLEDSEDDIESLSAISKNEDFLKALRDFRDSL